MEHNISLITTLAAGWRRCTNELGHRAWHGRGVVVGMELGRGVDFRAGGRVLPWLLWQISRTGSRDLFTFSVVVAAIGIAYGAAEESLPLRDAFSVLFFVSVGMLFEPSILMEQPIHVLGVVAIIIFGKSIAAFGQPGIGVMRVAIWRAAGGLTVLWCVRNRHYRDRSVGLNGQTRFFPAVYLRQGNRYPTGPF